MGIPCPIRVKVTGLILHNDNGSFPLLDAGETASACIDLLQNDFTFPNSIFSKWITITNHTMQNQPGESPFDNQTYISTKQGLIGTLDVVLEGGYNTTIPQYELVNPNRGTASDGSYAILNDSRIRASVNTGLVDYGIDFGVLLGGVFAWNTYILI